jgi:hypothetical protein
MYLFPKEWAFSEPSLSPSELLCNGGSEGGDGDNDGSGGEEAPVLPASTPCGGGDEAEGSSGSRPSVSKGQTRLCHPGRQRYWVKRVFRVDRQSLYDGLKSERMVAAS